MSLRHHSRNLVVVVCTAFFLHFSSDCSAQIQELGFLPDGRNSIAFDVSADGSTVVGRSVDSTGESRATVWTAGTGFQLIEGLPNDYEGIATSISNDGKAIATSSSEGQGTYYWSQATGPVLIEGPTGGITGGGSLSGNGEVLVGVDDGQAFRWAGNGNVVSFEPQPVAGLASQPKATSYDGSVAVGKIFDTSNFQGRAFRWTETTGLEMLEDFSGDVESDATSISDDGSIIVGDISIDGKRTPFRWTEETGLVRLGSLSDIHETGFGEAVSGDGSVVGGFGQNDSGNFEAILWTEETGVVSLYDYLNEAGHDLSHWSQLNRVYGISGDGSVVVGSGFNAAGEREAFLARLGTVAVPEPNSILMLIAFSPMLLNRRRRS